MKANNKKKSRQAKANAARSAKLLHPHIPDVAGEAYSKKYICTHEWPERKRGKGVVKKQLLRGIKCKASFFARLDIRPSATESNPNELKSYIVLISKQNTTHNHVLTDKAWSYYAENRRPDMSLLEDAKHFRQLGASVRQICTYLRKQSGGFTSFIYLYM